MDIATLHRSVKERTGLAEEQTERLLEATLATLAERINADEARHLAAQLPDDLEWPLESGAAERFAYDEFVRRVMVRADLGPDRAGVETSAVLGVLSEAVTDGEWSDVLAQLPGTNPEAEIAGQAPSDPASEELREALHHRQALDRWHPTDVSGEWWAGSDDDVKEGRVRAVTGEFEARVYRRPTGPTGPASELSNGPQMFATPDDAVDYAEANLGS